MPNDNMQFLQEERDAIQNSGTSPETGGRSYPGYFYEPPASVNNPTVPPQETNSGDMGGAQSIEEAYLDSLQAALRNNLGYFVVIEFLIGTSNLVEKEGVLFAVGNNFVTLYEQETDRYIVCDLFSVKFVTFFPQSPVNQGSGGVNGRYNNGYSQNSYGGMVPRRY